MAPTPPISGREEHERRALSDTPTKAVKAEYDRFKTNKQKGLPGRCCSHIFTIIGLKIALNIVVFVTSVADRYTWYYRVFPCVKISIFYPKSKSFYPDAKLVNYVNRHDSK